MNDESTNFKNNTRETIAQRVKFFRVKKGLSQKTLAKKCDISLATVTRVEQYGSTDVNIDSLIQIANNLNISLAELVGNEPTDMSLTKAFALSSFFSDRDLLSDVAYRILTGTQVKYIKDQVGYLYRASVPQSIQEYAEGNNYLEFTDSYNLITLIRKEKLKKKYFPKNAGILKNRSTISELAAPDKDASTIEDEKILDCLQRTIEKYQDPQKFCISGYSENTVCLNRTMTGWKVSKYEEGHDNPVSISKDLEDACTSFMRLTVPENYKIRALNDFLTLKNQKKDSDSNDN